MIYHLLSSITVDKTSIDENGGVSVITATISACTIKGCYYSINYLQVHQQLIQIIQQTFFLKV